MQELLLVVHCSKATVLAESLCEDLNSSYFTLPTTELELSPADIDTSDINILKNNVELTSKTLCLVTDVDTHEYVNTVEKLLSLDNFHDRIFLLCCNTDACHIKMPRGAFYLSFATDATIHACTRPLLQKASGSVTYTSP